ncbi:MULTISPECIES: protein kinase domain-containing protein [Streptomyces]|uniref:protein kinase domain-containing protein n=1 Tax=Streptomyces TaxID=1883 RepID=UPI00190832FC|nr:MULTISPECIES: protein kinase [unclassified Streptomyces]MCU4747779.1 protein kinase [Streptomyces sp. G-5]QQN78403.1 protein kinase [Streptomyces sp. XC 2026]
MAQEQGASGPGGEEAGGTASEVPDSPEMWGNAGLVGDGRYRLTHRLGRGGMAEVFAAEDVRLGRTVAVKLLRADLAEDPVSKARFTREAQSVAGLNHHAVVAVYDSGEETVGRNVVPYMVMELVEGQTIREVLMGAEPPTVGQALHIVSGVLEALAYSHQHGIVHRDIKPANVSLTDSGAVKVMDFGIARALHGAAQTMTQTGMVMGTPQYLSPEQALGKTIDTRSDLYAVGCMLYELLALRPPFVGETPLSVVYQHVQDMPALASEVNPQAPPELDGLVMRSLAKDPDDRFQTAEEMRALVQYAVRMLEEHGSHTAGLWNTGSVTPGGTPPMGTPAASRNDAPTSAIHTSPLLLGHPDAGGDGYDRYDGGSSGRRGRRGMMIVVAVLAVVGIGVGALIAANLGDDGGEKPPIDNEQVSDPTGEADDPADDEETDTAEEDPPADDDFQWNPGGGNSNSSGGGGGYDPPANEDTGEPTDSENTDSGSPDPTDTSAGNGSEDTEGAAGENNGADGADQGGSETDPSSGSTTTDPGDGGQDPSGGPAGGPSGGGPAAGGGESGGLLEGSS